MAGRLAPRVALIAVVLTTIGCDHVTKHIASVALAGEPSRSLWGDTVRLSYAENAGGFLSLGENLPPPVRTAVFTFGIAVLLVGAIAFTHRARWTGWRRVAIALFVAGGVSNWIDRAVRGVVIDFLNVGIGSMRTGVFNLADVAIMIGAGVFLCAEILEHRRADEERLLDRRP